MGSTQNPSQDPRRDRYKKWKAIRNPKVTLAHIPSPIHPYICFALQTDCSIIRLHGKRGGWWWRDSVPPQFFHLQGRSPAMQKECFVVSSLVPIPNSREGIRMPSLSQVSTMVRFTKFNWSGLYDLNTIIIIEDNGNGAKEKKKSLWAKQTAQKVTPTQVFCWIEGREEKKEGGRKGEKEGETNPYSDRETIKPRHEIVIRVKPEG